MPKRPITYQNLIDLLKKVPKERLQDHVSIEIDDEFFEAIIEIADVDCDVLDVGHVYLSAIVDPED